jgi:hypothetical protein
MATVKTKKQVTAVKLTLTLEEARALNALLWYSPLVAEHLAPLEGITNLLDRVIGVPQSYDPDIAVKMSGLLSQNSD